MKAMKWMLVLAAGLAMASSAFGAALIAKGANELTVAGSFDFATESGTRLDFGGRYAYFFWDRTAIGIQGAVFNNDAMHQFGIGGTVAYNFKLSEDFKPLFGTDFVPYVGGSVCYRHSRLFSEKENAFVFGGEAGAKFFLTDFTALTLSLVGELATEEIYADDLEATNKDLRMMLGMRFYF